MRPGREARPTGETPAHHDRGGGGDDCGQGPHARPDVPGGAGRRHGGRRVRVAAGVADRHGGRAPRQVDHPGGRRRVLVRRVDGGAWSRFVIPPVYGLGFAGVAALWRWTALRAPRLAVPIFVALWGATGALTHTCAVYGRGLLEKSPMLQHLSPASAIVFATCEFGFYGCVMLTLASLARRRVLTGAAERRQPPTWCARTAPWQRGRRSPRPRCRLSRRRGRPHGVCIHSAQPGT